MPRNLFAAGPGQDIGRGEQSFAIHGERQRQRKEATHGPRPGSLRRRRPASRAYDASAIEVLEGLEPVRKRPGMYIGGTDERALHHLVAEVLDNAMDEAVAGHANRIEVELHADFSLTVRDNGRGIPVDPHPRFPGKSALEVILCTLHAGGKFSGKAYQTSGGLHGVGVSVVNALSDRLAVEVARNRQLWRQEFSRGHPQGPLQALGPAPNRRGTTVTFHPDAEIFGASAHLKPARLLRMVALQGLPLLRRRDPLALRRRLPRARRRHAGAGDLPLPRRALRLSRRAAGGRAVLCRPAVRRQGRLRRALRGRHGRVGRMGDQLDAAARRASSPPTATPSRRRRAARTRQGSGRRS